MTPSSDTRFTELLLEHQSYMQLHKTDTFEKYISYISAFMSTKQVNRQTLEIIYPIFLKTDGEPKRIKYSKKIEKSLGSKRLECFIQLQNELILIILEKLDVIKKENLLAFNQAWFYAGNLLINEYQQLKFARNTLDFDDLEWYTYLLLNKKNSASWIQYKLDQRFEHILIDEFQDTNPTQWHLILPLLEELAANLHQSNKSLFFVGDTKQSIYGFRRANPQLQHTASNWAKQHLEAELLETDLSFRSSPAIIDFVNCVFDRREESSLIENFRTHKASQKDLWGYVQVNPLITYEKEINNHPKFRNPLLQARKNAEINCHYREGQHVANQIIKLLDDCTPVFENGQERLMHYGDIIILTRSRTHTPQIEFALREHNIPYKSISDNNFLNQLEVQDILALLTYLIQPHNDLALAQVLRSPCFGISDEDLMDLACIDANSWHEKLKIIAEDTSNPILSIALDKLQNWRQIADRVPVHDLLDKIYFEIDVLTRYASSCMPSKKNHVLANLAHILQLALDIDAGRYSSIQSFLNAIQKPGVSDAFVEGTRLNQHNENAVQIMTIHSAKGLEASVVFLVDTGSTPPKQHAYQSVINWPQHADRPEQFFIIGKKDTIDKTTQLSLKQQLNFDWKEELNLLYVALTRAKQYLFISGVQTKRNQEQCWHTIIEQALHDNSHESEDGVFTFTHGSPPIIKVKPPIESIKQEIPVSDLNKPIIHAETQGPMMKQTPALTSKPIEHGTLVHKLLELMLQPISRDSDTLHRETEFSLSKEINPKQFCTALEEVNKCMKSLECKEIFEPNAEDEILSEVPICYRENELVQSGIMDRLIISERSAWIIDFKSTADVSKNTMQKQAIHYRKQIYGYYTAVKKMYPNKDIRASILFTSIPALYDYDTNELSED